MTPKQPAPIQTQLRQAAAADERSPFNLHWADEAKRLMRWAAEVIDAANTAIHSDGGLR